MKQIGRKIYFDTILGNTIIDIGERVGFVIETTTEQDFQSYLELSERVPETVGLIQLQYGQYVQDFAECNGYRVNIDLFNALPDDRKHEALEFSYPDPNLPPEEQPVVYQKPLSEQVKELQTRTEDIELALTDIMLGGI